MPSSKKTPKTVDEYIKPFPPKVRSLLNEVRKAVRKAAPKAEETIKYGMPTYVQNGNAVSFGAYENHIGFYPTVAEYKKEQAPYLAHKSTLHFPLDKPLPLGLIRKVTQARVKDLQGRVSQKSYGDARRKA
ncbi:MAG TPA: DUF1801 domain-containing protein [Anaerolineales bacterium]|nr:DUF1801 domain-containing protein [Anaerolineales bacterium]